MIKRGVSLYSYQQNEFFHTMDWKGQLREVATNLHGADGIEIISECTIPRYPMPPESFIFEWNNEMARLGLNAVTMDTYMDTLQFRDHVLTIEECAERLKYDLRLASKLGFKIIRLCHNVPMRSVQLALPLAEELDIVMTNEIHAPSPIKPKRGVHYGETVARDVAFIERTGTKHYGLQPDMGIFQRAPSRVTMAYYLRSTMSPEDAYAAANDLLAAHDEMEKGAFEEWVTKDFPQINAFFRTMLVEGSYADPIDLYDIMPYIKCIHGKFYEMTEIEGKPGQYEDRSIRYPEVMAILSDCCYDGYINSEYEGQRSQQDMGYENLPNEVEQVRRHHEMMKRLIEDETIHFKV